MDESLAQLEMVSKASADELKNTIEKNSGITKRELVTVDEKEEGNSKKR